MNPATHRASNHARAKAIQSAAAMPESSPALASLQGIEPLGLEAAGIDTLSMLRTLLEDQGLFATDPATAIPQAAKRKVEEDADEDDDDEDEDEVEDDVEEDEEDADEDDVDDDEDEEDDDDEDEEEEDDDFDDADDDDFDDDDDEDDFDDDE